MKPFREQVLDLAKGKPGIRDDEIAAALECDLDEVYPAIRTDILEARVLAENVDARHRSYRMNSNFLGWKPPATGTGAPMAKADERQSSNQEVPMQSREKSKLDKAVDFIRARGVATDDDLRPVLGIGANVYPTSYLKMALQRGDVVKEGGEWRPGSGKPLRSLTKPASPAQPGKKRNTAPAIQKVDAPASAPTLWPGGPTAAPARRQQSQAGVANSLAIGELKIIAWDSGNLVISANDNTIDLNPLQVKALRAFVELT